MPTLLQKLSAWVLTASCSWVSLSAILALVVAWPGLASCPAHQAVLPTRLSSLLWNNWI